MSDGASAEALAAPPSRPVPADLLAGLSVAMVLIPQSMAYAELAGLPSHIGLFASALPPILAALFASSPYLQTGPVALTSLLTFGALASLANPGSADYVALAALLALRLLPRHLGGHAHPHLHTGLAAGDHTHPHTSPSTPVTFGF